MGNAGAIEGDRKRLEFLFYRIDRLTQLPDSVQRVLEATTRWQIEATDRGTGLRETNGQTLADAAARTSYERNLSIKAEQIHRGSFFSRAYAHHKE